MLHLWRNLITAVTLVLVTPAFAGDFANREIFGFSEDGKLFAFEEYGVQDGSGFPYSSIYIIDTEQDKWTAGSPFHVNLQDESKGEKDARAQSRKLAAASLAPITESGTIIATNQPLEVPDNPKRLAGRPWKFTPPSSDRIIVNLSALPFEGKDYCKDFGGPVGFRLTLENKNTKAERILHEDNSIPASRNCPVDYSLADIITYMPRDDGILELVVLVFVQMVGFEGPDGRYLAIPGKIDTNTEF